jgi:DUF1707 SHOCT-like domain
MRVGEVPVSTGSQDPAGAGRDRLRAGHADRERAIEALKTAFVEGRLTKDELAARTGRALAARTYAQLAALTADLPAMSALAEVAEAEEVPASPAAVVRRPMVRAAAAAGICLVVAAVAAILFALCDPEGNGPYSSLAGGFFILAILSVMTAVTFMGFGITGSIQQRLSRTRLPPPPPGPALGGEQHGGAGPGPVPPGHRTDETQTDLRAHKLHQRGRRSTAWAGRAPRGGIPSPGTA